MFEIFFMAIINLKLYDLPIYRHKKLGIYIITFFSTLFKILSTIALFEESNPNHFIYTNHYFLIPIGIIFFLLIMLLRSYALCKIKWLLDIKFILPSKILLLYNFLSAILCFIASIISSINPCTDSSEKSNFYNFYELICQIKVKKKNENFDILYYDNYSGYFEKFFKNILISITIFVLKTTFCFFNKVFTIYIIQNLSPEYIICSNAIFFILTEITDLILLIFIKDGFKFYKLFGMIAEIFCFIGSLIYLELIEFHCSGLNYNTKKNIKIRAEIDKNIGALINDENASFESFEKNENSIMDISQELINTTN
jgi:hypothetical protein